MIYKQEAIANQELHFATRSKKKKIFQQSKKLHFVLKKGKCTGKPLWTHVLKLAFVSKADINRPVLLQQLNILQMLNARMNTKLTGGPTSTNRMCFGVHV